jgi:hypothetical protein
MDNLYGKAVEMIRELQGGNTGFSLDDVLTVKPTPHSKPIKIIAVSASTLGDLFVMEKESGKWGYVERIETHTIEAVHQAVKYITNTTNHADLRNS